MKPMPEQTCPACGGTILSPTRGGVPRGTCHCPGNLTRSKEEDMTEKNTQEAPQAPAPKVPKEPRKISAPREFEPQGDVRAVKQGTKLAALIDALAREDGVTLDDLADELSRSGSKVDLAGVKSWISYDLRRTGLGIRQDGDRFYLVGTPLPHREATPPNSPETKAEATAPALKVERGSAKAKKAAMRPPKKGKAAR